MTLYRIMADNGPLAFVQARTHEEALATFAACYIVESPEEWNLEGTGVDPAWRTPPLMLVAEGLLACPQCGTDLGLQGFVTEDPALARCYYQIGGGAARCTSEHTVLAEAHGESTYKCPNPACRATLTGALRDELHRLYLNG